MTVSSARQLFTVSDYLKEDSQDFNTLKDRLENLKNSGVSSALFERLQTKQAELQTKQAEFNQLMQAVDKDKPTCLRTYEISQKIEEALDHVRGRIFNYDKESYILNEQALNRAQSDRQALSVRQRIQGIVDIVKTQLFNPPKSKNNGLLIGLQSTDCISITNLGKDIATLQQCQKELSDDVPSQLLGDLYNQTLSSLINNREESLKKAQPASSNSASLARLQGDINQLKKTKSWMSEALTKASKNLAQLTGELNRVRQDMQKLRDRCQNIQSSSNLTFQDVRLAEKIIKDLRTTIMPKIREMTNEMNCIRSFLPLQAREPLECYRNQQSLSSKKKEAQKLYHFRWKIDEDSFLTFHPNTGVYSEPISSPTIPRENPDGGLTEIPGGKSLFEKDFLPIKEIMDSVLKIEVELRTYKPASDPSTYGPTHPLYTTFPPQRRLPQ